VKKKEEFRAEGSEILCAIAQPEVIPKLPKQETTYVTTVTASISKEVLCAGKHSFAFGRHHWNCEHVKSKVRQIRLSGIPSVSELLPQMRKIRRTSE